MIQLFYNKIIVLLNYKFMWNEKNFDYIYFILIIIVGPQKNIVINLHFYLGAPGVEMEFVSCDNNTLRQVLESSIVLNELILEMDSQKYW